MSGWYAVKRGTIEHELFAPVGKWSKFEAWNWLIEAAAYRPTTIDIGGKPYTVPRGACCFSRRFLAQKWGWSRKAVDSFLDKLAAHGAVKLSEAKTGTGTRSKRSQITLCNYDKYQFDGAKTEPKRSQNGAKEEQVNNIPVGTADKSAVADPEKVMWAEGVKFLVSAGRKDGQSRSLLGKWKKAHGAEAVLVAIGKAQREGAIEPVEFIEGIFRHKVKTQAVERDGYTNAGAFGQLKEFN